MEQLNSDNMMGDGEDQGTEINFLLPYTPWTFQRNMLCDPFILKHFCFMSASSHLF